MAAIGNVQLGSALQNHGGSGQRGGGDATVGALGKARESVPRRGETPLVECEDGASDLARRAGNPQGKLHSRRMQDQAGRRSLHRPGAKVVFLQAAPQTLPAARSEENTSELQSR